MDTPKIIMKEITAEQYFVALAMIEAGRFPWLTECRKNECVFYKKGRRTVLMSTGMFYFADLALFGRLEKPALKKYSKKNAKAVGTLSVELFA